jgi:hypothetical protein
MRVGVLGVHTDGCWAWVKMHYVNNQEQPAGVAVTFHPLHTRNAVTVVSFCIKCPSTGYCKE